MQIDAIIEAVEDEDLAEIDLPQQLTALKRISEGCIEDTKAIKEKVANFPIRIKIWSFRFNRQMASRRLRG